MRSSRFAALDRRLAPAPDPARVAFLHDHDVAHRGLWGGSIPENSLAAAQAAIDAGYAIECDVRLSADGIVYVFHDDDTDRLCGRPGRFAMLGAEAIAALRLNGTDEPIPRLAGLLTLLAGRVPLLIEIKTDGSRASTLCHAVHETLDDYSGPVAVMAFNPNVSHWFGRHSRGIVHGLVMEEKRDMFDPLRRRLAVLRAKPDFLAYDVRALPSALPAALRRCGMPVLSWTVRTPEQRAAAATHADRPIFETVA